MKIRQNARGEKSGHAGTDYYGAFPMVDSPALGKAGCFSAPHGAALAGLRNVRDSFFDHAGDNRSVARRSLSFTCNSSVGNKICISDFRFCWAEIFNLCSETFNALKTSWS